MAALTATDAARMLRAGDLSSVELTEQCLRSADRLDGLGVYVTRLDERALAAARRADAELAAGRDRGPLHGIPVGVKDLLADPDAPTTAQSLVLDPAWGRDREATVVRRLKDAGAVITGKVGMQEFAIGWPDPAQPFPVPRNPWDPARWPGGSSSGSGAGVAAGLFLVSIGSDTGGSIRIPASLCGVSGLSPTFGRVPATGGVPMGWTLDHIGPLARSVADCAAVLQVVAGADGHDPQCVDRPLPDLAAASRTPLRGMRIGVERAHHGSDGADPDLAGALDAAIGVWSELGATITEVEIGMYDAVRAAQFATLAGEVLAYHQDDLGARWDDYGAGARRVIAEGVLCSAADYVQAQRVRRAGQAELAGLFRDVDVIACPTTVTAAPRYSDIGPDLGGPWLAHTLYWSAVGNPVLAVPIGFNRLGLPLSVQLAAAPFREDQLVRAGASFQLATEWHLAQPELAADDTARVDALPMPETPTRDLPSGPDAERARRTAELLLGRAGLTPHPDEIDHLAAGLTARDDERRRLWAGDALRYERPAQRFIADPPARGLP